ncbi:nucleoside-diphosphate-sugar epimerase family protein [Aspergillus sclerotiicarbonarius CBS 121057]|uniref:Nucleoside-diphosphate-sugar epimerase family protein n=1 Tax=Aspergillus sclerotiicarbonarius (strain CBS 121057 / IBT 28362) TaxID=1448318 RepID=A0A319EMG5_ASPSB|nr:nucleoside-diphosphate-sugar epimerase family protein [Aspergillus sclerotiicarbonarius CBS 121057]
MSRSILVVGATGKQGGSVVDALLSQDADVEILALTRDANSNSAQRLLQKSSKIKIVEGNLDDSDAIFRNAQKATSQPIWGVFSITTVVPGNSTHDAEEKQGKSIIDAALKNNVKYFVYTSVDRGGDASFDQPTRIPHFITKHNVEHHLVNQAKDTDMAWTILRPTAFFDNFTPDFFGKVFNTCWKISLRGKPLQLITVSDIGFFGAQAFLKPQEYSGKCVSLAGDSLTFDEMAKIFKQKTGKNLPMTFGILSRILMWIMKDLGYMFQWFHDSGYDADIPALKRVHPGLKDFGAWLETESGFMKE